MEISEKEPEIAGVMVPNCIYRGGCPEFTTCGLWKKFVDMTENKDDLLDIDRRYELYNSYFNEKKHEKG